MSKNLKVAVVGTGLIATLKHLPALRNLRNLDLVAVCDVNREHAEKVVAEFGSPPVYTDLGKMLAEVKPDIVDICTPPKLHARMALQCLEGGANLLIEKPMCQTVEECDEVMALAKKLDREICIAHSDLFYPSFAKARKLVEGGKIGKFRGMRIHLSTPIDYITSKPDHWAHKLPGGVFGETGPHIVYMTLAYINPIREVHVVGRKVLDEYPWSPFEDYRLELVGDNGTCTVSLLYTTNQWGADVELWGTEGTIRHDLESQTLIHKTRPKLKAVPVGISSVGESAQIISSGMATAFDLATKRYSQTHQALLSAFGDALRQGKPSPVPAAEGRESIRVMNLISDKLEKQHAANVANRQSVDADARQSAE
jgi:predicted dehydrogenase